MAVVDNRHLVGNTTFSLICGKSVVPMTDFKAAGIQTSFELDVDRLALADDTNRPGLEFRDIKMSFASALLSQQLAMELSAQTIHNRQIGKIHAKAEIIQPPSPAAALAGEATIINLPVALLDLFAAQKGLLIQILGEKIDQITAKIMPDSAPKSGNVFIIKAQSPRLTASLVGRYHRDGLVIESGSRIDVAITPQALAALQTPRRIASNNGEDVDSLSARHEQRPLAPLILERETTAHLFVKEFQLGFLSNAAAASENAGKRTLAPQRTKLDVALALEGAEFRQHFAKQKTSLRHLAVRLTTFNPADLVELNAVADMTVFAGAASGETSRLTSSTRIANLLDEKGEIAARQFKIDIDTQAKSLPIAILDVISGTEGQLTAIIGPAAKVALKAAYRGAAGGIFDLMIDSANLDTAIRGAIDADMTVRLREPAKLSLAVTPEISAMVLRKINPIFLNALSPKNAGERVECALAKGSSLKVNPLTAKAINVKADISVPDLRMKAGWGIAGFLGILTAVGAISESRDNFTAVFTPLTVDISQGVVSTSDFWFTSDDLAADRVIALGTRVDAINLATQQGKIAMGISGQTLRLVPELAAVIQPDYMYELPVSGFLTGMEPNYSECLKQIILVKTRAEAMKRVGEKSLLAAELAKEIARMIPQAEEQKALAQRWPHRPGQAR